MKKADRIFSKIISALLCVCIITGSGIIGFKPKAISGKELNDVLDVILNMRLDNQGDVAQNGINSACTVLEHLKEFEKAQLLAESANTWSNVVDSAFTAIGRVGMTFTLINGSITFMRTIGLIEDPTQTALMSIQSTVDNIKSKVQEVNKRTVDLQSTVSKQFAEMKLEFNNEEFTSYQLLWTTFYNDVVYPMQQYENSYSGNVTSLFIDYAEEWQSNDIMGLRSLYNADGAQIYSSNNIKETGTALPVQPTQSNDETPVEYAITLPGNYIHKGINSTVFINADNYMKILKSSIENGVFEAAENGDLTAYSGFYDKWNTLNNSQKTELSKNIAADLIDALAFEISYEAANTGNFASDVQSKFNQYCNYIRQNDNLISPFVGQLKMLALTHGFEGQIKDDAAYLYTYFCNQTIDFGTFASMIMSLAQNKTAQDRENTKNIWWLSQKAVYNDLNSFITGSSNYCYLINKTIEYRDVELKSDMTTQVGYQLAENEYGELSSFEKRWVTTYYETYSSTDWEIIDRSKQYSSDRTEYSNQVKQYSRELKNSMISSDEAMLIFCMYKSELSGGNFSGSFTDYLVDNNVAVKGSYDSTQWHESFNTDMITSLSQPEEFSLSDGEYMNNVSSNPYCDYFGYVSSMNVNTGNKSDIENQYFHIHDRIKGDVFNLSTGNVAKNITVAARAFYGENHLLWSMDEYAFFANADNIEIKDEKLGVGIHKSDYSDHKLTATVHKYVSAIVSVPNGTYTIPANVTSVKADMFKNGSGIRSLTFNGTPKSISSDAFSKVGSAERRCYLNYPASWGSTSLAGTWKSGYFADTTITVKSQESGFDDINLPAAIGEPCINIPCPYNESVYPEHKTFAGWALNYNGTPVKNNLITVTPSMTLYSVWKYDHNFVLDDIVEATCTEDGHTGKTVCSVCGETGNKGYITPRLGHNYVFDKSTGQTVCTRCGKAFSAETKQYGDFTVSGENIDNTVEYDSGVLTVIDGTPITVKNTNPDTPTTNRIIIRQGISADVTFAGVNIVQRDELPAVMVESFSYEDVIITLADSTENNLVSGDNCAGIQTEGFGGILKIYGNGKLTVQGGKNAAGIGGGNNQTVNNIKIYGGCITALGGENGAGIGGGLMGYIDKVEIIGGEITANSGGSDINGICGGYDSNSGESIFCDVTFYSSASVKMNAENSDFRAVNEENEVVTLNIIDNPSGQPIYIDGIKFPRTEHNGEKKVYVYLADKEHNIETEELANLLLPQGDAYIDYNNRLIYGISECQTEIDSFVKPADGYTMNITKSSSFCGTNTVVDIICDGKIIESYAVVVFGDVDGDGICNGMDSVIINSIVNGMLTESSITKAEYAAADCCKDDIISSEDTEFSEHSGIMM